jgi:hypothetical protein
MKWTILILVVLVLVVAGCFTYWDITDTTPGRKWTQVTASAPFGSLSGFTSVEYKGNLWIIGGAEHVGDNGEAWHTSDGITWNGVSSPVVVPQRDWASSAVFKDALWVIGGKTDETQALHHDAWYSSDGFTWSDIQPAAEFSPRFGHSTVVFKDRIWVIGGNLGNMSDNLANDVWYSDNGISWQQATPAAEFSPRSDHSSFVYQDKIWVIGGRNSHDYFYDVWYSGDGIHWTQATASAPFGDTSIKAVVFDGRIWVLQTTYGRKATYPWGTEKSPGIWYSYDGITWTKVMSSPGFFDEEYNGRQPVPIVFDNRLWVLQQYSRGTGIWYTMAN